MRPVDDVVVELPRATGCRTAWITAASEPGRVRWSLRPFAGPLDTHRELELLELPAGR